MKQVPDDFVYLNPETHGNVNPVVNRGDTHIACVLLVDVSGSMSGPKMDELNRGLQEFGRALQQDDMASGCADISIISFGSKVQTVVPFIPAQEYCPPTNLMASGMTCMNEAILNGLAEIESRKAKYRELGVSYYRPWMFLLTDGEPNDEQYEKAAKNRLNKWMLEKKINFFPMGIGDDANLNTLRSYTLNGEGPVLKASADNFKEAFVWLSSSISVISNADDAAMTGGKANIPSPTSFGVEIL